MRAWNVFRLEKVADDFYSQDQKRLIDIVFFNAKHAVEVKYSLINHDGYPRNIYVTRRRRCTSP